MRRSTAARLSILAAGLALGRPAAGSRGSISRRSGVLLALLCAAVAPAVARAQAADAPEALNAAPGTLFLHPERFRLADGSYSAADRGVLFVPANRATPGTGVFALEFYRFPKRPEASGDTPPIFVLKGGPSWPGLGDSLEDPDFYEEQILPFAGIADVVFVGQRGIGSSRPNTACEPPARFPIDAPPSEAEQVEAWREASRKCRAYWESEGVDLSGLTVIEAAADVNDVRKALGYEKIQLSGGSFGSHWGMAVLRFHPEIVERAVLTGMEGPDHTYDMPGWVLNSLRRTAEDAETSEELRELIPASGLIAALEALIARLDDEPVVIRLRKPGGSRRDSIDITIDGEAVVRFSRGYTPAVPAKHRMSTWPADILTMHSGNLLALANWVLRSRAGGGGSYQTAAFFMLDCGSGISREREAVLDADPANRVVGKLGLFYQANCPAWEADLGEEFRKNFETEIPTVIVHGNWDLSTPLENALELLPYFKNSTFVLVERGTHGALGEALRASDDFRDALHDFMAAGDSSRLPERVVLPPLQWVVPRLATP